MFGWVPGTHPRRRHSPQTKQITNILDRIFKDILRLVGRRFPSLFGVGFTKDRAGRGTVAASYYVTD